MVKCLNQHHLLPRVISGTSVGALIAGLVCIHTDDELPEIFTPNGINLQAFARVGLKGSIQRKLLRLIKQGKWEMVVWCGVWSVLLTMDRLDG